MKPKAPELVECARTVGFVGRPFVSSMEANTNVVGAYVKWIARSGSDRRSRTNNIRTLVILFQGRMHLVDTVCLSQALGKKKPRQQCLGFYI